MRLSAGGPGPPNCNGELSCFSAVNLAAVADLYHQDHQRLVPNLVNDSVVADANAIKTLYAGKLVSAWKTRLAG